MSEPRAKVWISLFVLVVFLVGLGVGVVAAPWVTAPWVGATWFGDGSSVARGFGANELSRPGRRGSGRGRGRERMSNVLMERLSSAIDLTDEQNDHLVTVFDARRDRFRELSREMRERFDRERETFRTAVAEILTAEQMELFEAENVRMSEERRQRYERRGNRPESGRSGF